MRVGIPDSAGCGQVVGIVIDASACAGILELLSMKEGNARSKCFRGYERCRVVISRRKPSLGLQTRRFDAGKALQGRHQNLAWYLIVPPRSTSDFGFQNG
jgi:hypothetical protein